VITLLLVAASVLGLLAFFEPCTIATHTLFSVRASRAEPARCYRGLAWLWLSRTALMVLILLLAVALTTPPEWGEWLPGIGLSVMALIYMVSRFVYLPVPHLAFYRLLPNGGRLSQDIQLGLTLPACTLPLVVVVTMVAITLDDLLFAALAGVLFASLFTLPVAFASWRGLNEDGRQLLQRAANGSPWLTAVILLGAALYFFSTSLDVNAQTLESVLQNASWAGVGFSFLAGFVFSFNPVSFASIPVVLAYVTRAHEKQRALVMGSAFVAGMLVTHVLLGVTAALGGQWVQNLMGREWGLLLGPVLIFMGLIWVGLIKIRLGWFGVRGRRASGIGGAFLLGIPFSVAVCPFCTPALMVTLTASASVGSVTFGFALLLAFALGRSIPIILGAWSMGWLESLRLMSCRQKMLENIAGGVLVLTGLYLLNEYFLIIQF